MWTYTLNDLARIAGASLSPDAPGESGFSSVCKDTRTLQPGQVYFALKGERFDGEAFVGDAFRAGALAAVATQPHGEGPCLVVDDPLRALQDFALHHRERHPIDLLGITGSCGKTSSKDYTAAVLGSRFKVVKTQGNLNNDIGCPLSLLEIDDNTDFAVIEMGANHKGEIARLCEIARPTESAITLVAPSHLEGFGTLEDVASAKAEIAEALGPDGLFYVNVDNPWCVQIAERVHCQKMRFGTTGDVRYERCRIEDDGEMRLTIAPIGELRLPLPIRAHAWNVMLAIAVGMRRGLGEDADVYEEPLRRACANATRFRVLRVGPAEVIDDTYNANPASMAAALETLAERPASRRIAVLGDMLELGPTAKALHAEMGELAARLKVNHLFVRGEFAPAVVEAARAGGLQDARVFEEHDAMAEAAAECLDQADNGTAPVLLVKGSRGMRMEKVIEAFAARFPQED